MEDILAAVAASGLLPRLSGGDPPPPGLAAMVAAEVPVLGSVPLLRSYLGCAGEETAAIIRADAARLVIHADPALYLAADPEIWVRVRLLSGPMYATLVTAPAFLDRGGRPGKLTLRDARIIVAFETSEEVKSDKAVQEYYGAVLRAPHYPPGPAKPAEVTRIGDAIRRVTAASGKAVRARLIGAAMEAVWESQIFIGNPRFAATVERKIKELLACEDMLYLPPAYHAAAAKILRAIAEIRSSAPLPECPALPP